MHNFDLVISVSKGSINALLAAYHANPPAANNPFQIHYETESSGLSLKANLNVTQAPVIAFEKPSAAVWEAAQRLDGKTNGEANVPLPSMDMLQFQLPAMDVDVTIGESGCETGVARNSIGHVTLDFTAGKMIVTLVAVTVDKTEFEAIDLGIFNAVAVPMIFETVNKVLPVIDLPAVDLPGVSLNTITAMLRGDIILAASTLITNPDPVDLSGLIVPADPMFVLVSKALMERALSIAADEYKCVPFHQESIYVNALDFEFDASIYPAVSLGSIKPLVFNFVVTAELTLGINIYDGAIEEVVEQMNGCAVLSWMV